MSDGNSGLEVKSDPDLSSGEKEVTIRGANRADTLRVHSDVPVVCRYLLEQPDAEIVDKNTKDGAITSVIADIDIGLLRLSAKPRQSKTWGDTVADPTKRDDV